MKVGIVLTPFGEKKPAGLAGYILNLTIALVSQGGDTKFKIFIKGQHDTSIFTKYKNTEVVSVADSIFWKDIAYVHHHDIDVWIYNNPNMPLIFKPKKSLVIALDFSFLYKNLSGSFLKKNKIFLLKKLQQKALYSSTKVVCMSESTKSDLFKFFPNIPREKVCVSMSGFTRICEKYKQTVINGLPDNYYLIVGVIKPRKNQHTAVEAFIRAKEKGIEGKLIICGKGKGKYFDELMDFVDKSHYKDDIKYMGYCTNEELVTLYKNARALIFPSHIEGFGMPVVEAMSCGIPVIASSNGAVGEIANGYALTVNSSDINGFTSAILLLQNDSVRERYITKGIKRSNEFSWKKTALEFLDIINIVKNSKD